MFLTRIMDKKMLNKFKKSLLERQQTLHDLGKTGDDAAKTVELDQSRVGRLSRMDALQDQAMSQEVQRRRQIELKKIAVALNRIKSGEFGYCTKCEKRIAAKRLELDPSVSLCIDCASAMD